MDEEIVEMAQKENLKTRVAVFQPNAKTLAKLFQICIVAGEADLTGKVGTGW